MRKLQPAIVANLLKIRGKSQALQFYGRIERRQTHEKTADTEKTREFLEHSQDSRQLSCVRKNRWSTKQCLFYGKQ